MPKKFLSLLFIMLLCGCSPQGTTEPVDAPRSLGWGFENNAAYEQFIFDRAVVTTGLVDLLSDVNRQFTIVYPDILHLENELIRQGKSVEEFLASSTLETFVKSHIIEGQWLMDYDLLRSDGKTFTTMAGTTMCHPCGRRGRLLL
ncbi:MAG: hypothetical protein ACRCYY_11040 [Trueperaceae bacterium]